MGLEVALVAAAVVAATKTAVDSYTQYQNAKSDVKYARNMQSYNRQQEMIKQQQLNRTESEKAKDLSRRHRLESGSELATQAAQGLSMNTGSLLASHIESKTAQQIESNRLIEGVNEERYNVKLGMQQANHALEVRKWQAKKQKQAAVVNASITLGGMAVGGIAGGYFGAGGFTAKNVATGALIGGGSGGTAASIYTVAG